MQPRTTIWLWLLIVGLLLPVTVSAQSNTTEDDWEGKTRWEFFLSFALDGAGVGVKRKWGDVRKTTHGFNVGWVGSREDDESRTLDPFTGRIDVNRTRWMFMFPLHYNMHKRLFVNDIEDNFRPFVSLDVGPTIGLRFPSGHGLTGDLSRAQTKVTIGGFLGGGMEFEIGEASMITISAGYRLAAFFSEFKRRGDDQGLDPNTGLLIPRIKDEQSFNSIEIRMGIVTGL